MSSKKLILISEETHKAFKAYCDTFNFKIGDKADTILTEFLLKEAGGVE